MTTMTIETAPVIEEAETVAIQEETKEPSAYKVYEYGVTKITAGLDPARAQMRARAAYWNELVGVEREYRDAIDAVISAASPTLAEVERQIAEHQAALMAVGVGERQRKAADYLGEQPPAIVDTKDAAELRAILKPLYAEQKRLRKEAIAAAKPELKECDTDRKAKHREARQRAAKGEPVVIQRGDDSRTIERAPLYWGNYMDIDAAYNTARRRFGRQLKYHSGANEDMVSVQATNGLSVESVWGKDGRVQLDPVDPRAWTSPVRGERRRLARTTGRLRVGSDDDKNPVWLEFACVLHRPLPPTGKIRRVSVVTRRVATVQQMRLLVTVETPQAEQRPEQAPYIGIDIGWRRMGKRLRVAMVVGPNGTAPRELALPGEFVEAMKKSEEIHSGRELDFNRARAKLSSWIQTQLAASLPDWFKEAVRYMEQWKAPGRLARLYWQWREGRFDGDGAAFGEVEEWFRHDRHLWDWEANARDQAIARRKNIFRGWASELARLANDHKASLALERFDLRGVIGTEDELKNASHMRSLAGVGILRQTIRHTAAREGVPVAEVPSKDTTRMCNVCWTRDPDTKNLVQFDAASEVRARCGICGTEWDQDENAAKNLILLAERP